MMRTGVRRVFGTLLVVSVASFAGEEYYRNKASAAVATHQATGLSAAKIGSKETGPRQFDHAHRTHVSGISERSAEEPKNRVDKWAKIAGRDNETRMGDVIPTRFYARRGLNAAEVADEVAKVRRGLVDRSFLEHNKLKLMLDGSGDWERNLVTRKLQSGVEMAASGRSRDPCLIRVLQFCGSFCKHVKGGLEKRWVDYSCGSMSPCTVHFKIGVHMRDLMVSDVVIFMPGTFGWKNLVRRRPAGQLWVFHSKESPGHWVDYTPPPELGNPFNLSITYMSDSDVVVPYYFYVPSDNARMDFSIPERTGLMSWMATNCDKTSWNRMGLVRSLKNHLRIDTYGLCGDLVCRRSNPACADLPSRYKFHLALENSQCPEYITEKFWSGGLLQRTVPVVFGAPKEDYARLAPPNSFIHLDDFDSTEDFADYIKKLDANETLYREYFKWWELGSVLKGESLLTFRKLTAQHICYVLNLLVEKSFSPSKYSWQHRHSVFHQWWRGICHEKLTVLGQDISFTPAPMT